MATVPTPLTAVAGAKLTATAANAGYRDPLNWWMTNRPRVHAYDAVGVSMANGTDTLLTFNSEVYDNDSMHSISSLTSRITFTTAGLYTIRFQVQFPAATWTVFTVNARLNSAENPAAGTTIGPFTYGPSTTQLFNLSFAYQVVANDHMQFWINQSSGGAKTTVNGTSRTFCQAIWESN